MSSERRTSVSSARLAGSERHRLGRLILALMLAFGGNLFVTALKVWSQPPATTNETPEVNEAPAPASSGANLPRPNIVWIMSEDNSIHYLDHFFPGGARAPAIEALASEGLTFTRAYSCSPVCSVARTTLITSCYAPRLGTQYHRRSQRIQLPEGLEMFPAALRRNGYYTTNNRKQDYNATGAQAAWDASSGQASWRNRPNAETPFFHVQTFTASHESSLHFRAEDVSSHPIAHDPDSVDPAPFLPDTELVRYTHARYLDRIQQIDDAVAGVVTQLKEDGLWDRTIVFYFGDHGGVLPRSKGYAYDTGLHVPLVIRIPDQYRERWKVTAGSRDDRFVEFVDFGPTVLSLADVPLNPIVDGEPFLGSRAASDDQFESALGYADRFDEKYDLVRSLHRGPFHYLRNYQPFYPDGLQNNYRYRMAAYRQWRTLANEGSLDARQSAFFQPRPVEMLFDLQSDPFEVNNLAADPQYRQQLNSMRAELGDRLRQLPDLSFLPESVAIPRAAEQPLQFATDQQPRIAGLIDTADLCLLTPEKRNPAWRTSLESSDPWERYWALTSAASLGAEMPAEWTSRIRATLRDAEPLVRTRGAVALAVGGDETFDPRPPILEALAHARSSTEALLILNDLVFVHDGFEGRFAVAPDRIRCSFQGGEVARRLEYLGVTSP